MAQSDPNPLIPQINRQASADLLPGQLAKAQAYGKFVKEQSYKVYISSHDPQNPIFVEAWLPETVGLDISAQYDAPYAQGLTNAVPQLGKLANFLGLSLTTQALTMQVWQGGSVINITLPMVFQAEKSGAFDVMKPIKDLLKLTMPKELTAGGLLTAPGPRVNPNRLAQNGGPAISQAASALVSGAGNTLINGLQAIVPGTGVSFGQGFANTLNSAANTASSTLSPLSNALINSIENNISLHIGNFLYISSVVITDVSPTYDVQIGPDGNPQRATVNVGIRTFFLPTDRDIEDMFPSATDAQLKGVTS